MVSTRVKLESRNLLQAIVNDDHVTVNRLLQQGFDANINAGSWCENIPLLLAAWKNSREIVRCLLRHNVDTAIADDAGRTALNWAALRGHDSIVELLLAHGANVHSKDQCGFTPLHVACVTGNTKIMRILIEHGACITTTNQKGQTARDVAVAWKHDAVVQLWDELVQNKGTICIHIVTPPAALHVVPKKEDEWELMKKDNSALKTALQQLKKNVEGRLSDTRLLLLAERQDFQDNWWDIGRKLGFTGRELNEIIEGAHCVKLAIYDMLQKWRDNQNYSAESQEERKIRDLRKALEKLKLGELARLIR